MRYNSEESPRVLAELHGAHGRGLGKDVDSAVSDAKGDKVGKDFEFEDAELIPEAPEEDKGGRDEDDGDEKEMDAEDSELVVNELENDEMDKDEDDKDANKDDKEEDDKDVGAGFVENELEEGKDDNDKNNVVDDFEVDEDDKDNGNEDDKGEENKDVDFDENEEDDEGNKNDKDEENKDVELDENEEEEEGNKDDKDVELDENEEEEGNKDDKDEDNKDADLDEIEEEEEGNKDDKDEDNKDVDLDENEDEQEAENGATPFALPDIVDIAMETSSLSSLYRLVAAAGLGSTLRGPGPFTLFAPIDTAFPAGAKLSRIQAGHTPPAVMTYHVVPGLLRSTDLYNGEVATTLHGDNITAFVYPATGTVMIDHATIIYADVEASNGIVHFIDRVLEPSSVCSALQVSELECATMEGEVGVMVCRDGTTTCSLASEFLEGDTCGCCPRDTSPNCRSGLLDGESWESMELAPVPPATPSANSICSTQQVSELACDVVEDVSGVVVCRGGNSTCALTVQTQEGDSCGCCEGDNAPVCDGVNVAENLLGGGDIDFFGGEEDINFEIERCLGC